MAETPAIDKSQDTVLAMASMDPGTLEQTNIIESVVAFRFAGVQCRLYPEQIGPQQRAVHSAIRALNRTLSEQRLLIISNDNFGTAVNGKILTQRDVQIALHDISAWMSVGRLRAIGFIPGVSEDELLRFLQVLVGNEALGGIEDLDNRITELGLTTISVVAKHVSVEVPLKTALIDYNPAFAVAVSDSHIPEPQALVNPTATSGINALLTSLALQTSAASINSWKKVAGKIEQAEPAERRSMLTVLAQWLRTQQELTAALGQEIEHFLLQLLLTETATTVVRAVAMGVERRMEAHMEQLDWPGICRTVTALRVRLERDEAGEVTGMLTGVLERASAWTVGQAMALPPDSPTAAYDEIRPLFRLLGEWPIQVSINRLKTSSLMQERIRLLRILREFGEGHVALLVKELRANNPWYVYRNVLQVLADVGTNEALGPIDEKLRYADPRVRAAALGAAVEIARQQATPYLVQGLEDDDPDVRARAASLAGRCLQPRILHLLIRLLQTTRLEKDEPEAVQLAAATALAQFGADEARETLLQILQPSLFSSIRKKTAPIRAAAATALTNYLPHPAVTEALQRASGNRSQLIGQAAQRALGQLPENP